jgi:hypothetical protein
VSVTDKVISTARSVVGYREGKSGGRLVPQGPDSPIVTAMGKRLVAEGCSAYKEGPGPQWTAAGRDSYARWQRKCGCSGADADGWPGTASWDALKVPNVYVTAREAPRSIRRGASACPPCGSSVSLRRSVQATRFEAQREARSVGPAVPHPSGTSRAAGIRPCPPG